MKMASLFLLFLFSCPALAQELVRCYPLNRLESGELCLPSISQGKRIIFSQVNANSIPELQDLFPLTTAENKAEQFLLQNFPQNHFLVANSLLGKMGNLFNQAANFGGPNCYQSALYASSSPYSTEWRYVSPEEFELNLKLAYDKVDQPQFGDIVVYEATGERGHAAVYLFDDLVFHKKSYQKEYLYRITKIDQVAEPEAFEWTPRPDSQISRALQGMSTKDRAYYRKKESTPELSLDDPKEEKRIALINELGKQILLAAPQWKVGTYLGFTTENLAEELVTEFRSMQNHPSPFVRMSYARLISYRDQLFQSIEDYYFSSPLASGRIERINQEVCVVETAQFKSIVGKLLEAYEHPATEDSIQRVMKTLQNEDKKNCRFSLLKMIKN